MTAIVDNGIVWSNKRIETDLRKQVSPVRLAAHVRYWTAKKGHVATHAP
jgi:hypothetical protein